MDDNQQDVNQQDTSNSTDNSRLDGLRDVRKRATAELISLLPTVENIGAERKFSIYLSAIGSAGDASLANNALDAALQIGDPTLKTEALEQLIDEIDEQTK